MSAVEALRMAQENGVHLGVSGADLLLDAEREPESRILETIWRHKAEIVALLATEKDAWSAEDWQVFFDERAGIAEFDGELSRSDAEALAFSCCVSEWMNRNSVTSPPDCCLGCGGAEHELDPLLPFGTENSGHVWLHHHCWRRWYDGRISYAVAALAKMGIVERNILS